MVVIILTTITSSCQSQLKSPSEYFVVVVGDTSGDYKQFGESIFQAAKLASENLGDLPDDIKLSVRKEDDGGKNDKAIEIATKIITDPTVVAAIGHASSGNTLAAIEIYGPRNFPLLMPIATNPEITAVAEENGWSSIYRLVPTDDLQASKVAEFINKKEEIKDAIVFSDKTTYGDNLGKRIIKELNDQEIKTSSLKYVGEKSKYQEIFDKLKPSYIVFSGYYGAASKFVNTIRQINSQLPIILTDGCFSDIFLDNLKDNINTDNIYVSFIAPPWKEIEIESTKALVERLEIVDGAIDIAFAPFGYDSFILIRDAANSMYSEKNYINRKGILEYLKKNKEYTQKGSSLNLTAGSYRFNKSGDNELGRTYIYKLKLDIETNRKEWELL